MVRRVFAICSAASLVLCVVVCAAWVRSYWVSDQFRWVAVRADQPNRMYDRHVLVGRGVVVYGEWVYTGDALYAAGLERKLVRRGLAPYVRTGAYNPLAHHDSTLGFAKVPWPPGGGSVSVPLWFAAACLALPALPAAASLARRVRQRLRRPEGLCRHCGYDLRATPQRCPECGRVSSK